MKPKTSPDEQSPHQLIVEGANDKWAVINLMLRSAWAEVGDAPWLPFVHDAGDVNRLLKLVGPHCKSYDRVGVVVDANGDSSKRWTQVRGELSRADVGLVLPPSPAEGGIIVKGADKRFGVWLMPNNRDPGRIEEMFAQMIPTADAAWPWAQEAVHEAEAHGARFARKDALKAQVHTWLAWQEEPGLPFGKAIERGLVSADAPLALAFVDWMDRLFRRD